MTESGSAQTRPRRKFKLPPDVFRKAKELEVQSGIPFKWAVKVAQGESTLVDVLESLRLRDEVDGALTRGTLSSKYSGEVLKGNLSLDDGMLLTRLAVRKRKSDYMKTHLEEYADSGEPVVLSLVSGRMLTGHISKHTRFEVVLTGRDGTEESFHKHDIKFFFDARKKKHVLKAVRSGGADRVVESGHLEVFANRRKIRARYLLAALEAGRTVAWETVEGDVLRGRIIWHGRYEVRLETSRGPVVVLMRHAVRDME